MGDQRGPVERDRGRVRLDDRFEHAGKIFQVVKIANSTADWDYDLLHITCLAVGRADG